MLVNTTLERIRRIVKVSDDSTQLTTLEELADIQMEALLARLGLASLPEGLEYIVVETTISRYNRLGSEGLNDESIDVISQSFIQDLFEPYTAVIERYRVSTPSSLKRVRMI